MRIINTASGMTTLLLGRLGENERTQFVFDVEDWLEEYPAATIAMYNQLPHSEESYPVVISQPENGKVTWTVADSELQTEGYGRCELVAVEGETVVKGHIWKTRILESLDGAGEVPDPWESWMTEFTQLKGAAEDAAEAAEDAKESIEGMSVEATTLPAGSDATVTKTVDQVTGAVTMSFGLPQGRPGTPGYEAIDDAAGLGDTDKAWSADKLSKEFAKDRNNANISGSLKVGTYNTTVQDANTVAFGRYSTAVGTNSLASGNDTNARGSASQAFGAGSKTEDDASASAVFGAGNIAKGAYQLVFGRYNAVDNGTPDSVGRRNYIEIVGNGNGTSSRLNARTLDWQGNERLRGNLYVEANVDGSGGTQVAKITDIPDLAIDDTAGTGDTDVTWSADKITGELADKYEKPASGIPATDLASGVIPTVHNVPAGGTTGQVLTKTSGTDYATEWTTPQVATDAQVAQAVDDWLDENVAQETGYVLDRTLLLSNAAAPADLVGDLKNAIDGEVSYNYTEGKKITASSSTYSIDDDANTCVSEMIEITWEWDTSTYVRFYYNGVSGDPQYFYRIIFFDENLDYIGNQSGDGGTYRSVANLSGGKYVRFSFKKGTTGKLMLNAEPQTVLWEAEETLVRAGLISDVDELKDRVDTAETTIEAHTSQIEDISDDVDLLSESVEGFTVEETKTETKTIVLNNLTWESGYVTNGEHTESDSYKYASIPVISGDKYAVYVDTTEKYQRFVDLMNGATVSSALQNQMQLTIPANVDHIVMSIAKSFVDDSDFAVKRTRTEQLTIRVLDCDDEPTEDSEKPVKSGGVYDAIEDAVSDLLGTETESKEVTTSVQGLTWLDGYVYEGTHYDSDAYKYTTIQVQPGDSYQPEEGDGTQRYVRMADLMNGSTRVSTVSNQSPLEIPTGVTSAVISVAKNYVTGEGFKLLKTVTVTEEIEVGRVPTLEKHVLNTEENGITLSFDLSAGSVYSDPGNRALSDYCGYNLAFTAKIPSALTGQIVVGKGYGIYDGCAIGLDATNVYIYVNAAEIGSPSSTYAHGLTLKDYVSIEIDAGYSIYACSGRIKTNGGEYSFTPSVWRGQDGILSVRSTLDALTDCVLSYACPALDNEIWIYGDSYTSCHNQARWAYWLVNEGHTKFLLNSDPGRASPAAYQSLLVDLSMNKRPKKIIWLMGMNDKDGDSAANTNWVTAVEAVEDFCEENGIELILATIPNVPSSATKNTLKNAYVVASGHRYIDWANAVSADGSSTWYDNMLNEDNVHPDKEGAKALYTAAITTVPELLK